jgi:1-acyl-sn-glycerol-3-phosphate acyltransferase
VNVGTHDGEVTVSGMRGAPRLYRTLHRVVPGVVGRYLTLAVDGLDNVPAEGGAVLAANHLSFIDSILLPLRIPRPVYFLGKAEYFATWRTRWFVAGTGVVPVNRHAGDRGRDSLDVGVRILTGGDLLGIYPEGTRSPDGRLYRGKTGPVRMALQAGVPIIPCGVRGTREVMPEGRRFPRRGEVSVTYGEPLDLDRYRGHDDDPYALRAATDEVMYEIMRLSGQSYVDAYAARVKSSRPPPSGGTGAPGRGGDGGAGDEPPASGTGDGFGTDGGDGRAAS